MDPFENGSFSAPKTKFQRSVRGLVVPMQKYDQNHSGGSGLLALAWIVSSIVTVLVPLIYRTIHKNKYRQEYMNYFWEEEYQTYAEQRKQNYEQYGNSYKYGGAYMADNYAQNEYVDVNRCSWWKLNCFSFFVNRDGEPMADQEWMPAWYSGFSLTEEQRRDLEDNLEQPGSLKFVYVWQIVLFLALGYYGLLVISQKRNPTGLIVSLLVWSNFAFLTMWMMADGSIVTEGQQVKRTGFYGQMSVLIFLTNFWYLLHGLIFVLVFWIRKSIAADEEVKGSEGTVQELGDKGYSAPATTEQK